MSRAERPVVLLMIDWYEPGFKAGGPIRSMVNFVEQCKDALDIHVLTTDRDLGDSGPYPGIVTDTWIRRDGYTIYYMSPAQKNRRSIEALMRSVKADHLYLNSMFSYWFAILPAWLNRKGAIASKTVLAPRGMLKDSALQHKSVKKKLFLAAMKISGLHRSILFQATDKREAEDVATIFGKDARVVYLPNLPGKQPDFEAPGSKVSGALNMIFVGRIHPIKNLDLLLDLLKSHREKIHLTVVATLEDMSYWEECQRRIAALPANLSVELRRDVPNMELNGMIREHDLFVLPTKGENFGHSIFEALSNGRPVIISDQTPWRGLEAAGAGYVLSLDDRDGFHRAISSYAAMDQPQLTASCRAAWDHCRAWLEEHSSKKAYIEIFN